MSVICYLCGEEIREEENTDDHVVPRQFIKRKQPKAKGFDYAGVLPTHRACNNNFGDEKICQKSLQLIEVLHNPEYLTERQHGNNPEIRFMGIDSNCLPGFTQSDLRFFKVIDPGNCQGNEWLDPGFYKDKQKAVPLKQPLNVALSVLAKSGAAVLVKRLGVRADTLWRILCIPYHGASSALDFDDLLGKTKPFEIDVKLWVVRLFPGTDFFAVYRSHTVLLYMFFWFSSEVTNFREVKRVFNEADHFYFEGSKLIALSGHDWTKQRL